MAGSLVADAAPLLNVSDTFIATVDGVTLEVPEDPAEELVLGDASSEIAIYLPEAAGVGDGVVDESGAVVYESSASAVSLAAQATEDGGAQILAVIESADAPSEYRYEMAVPEGAALQLSSNGGAEVLGPDGVIAFVAPPWAVDANGQPVPTRYQIDGTTLVQVIDERNDAAFPIIADPRFFWVGLGLVAIEFNLGETKEIGRSRGDSLGVCGDLRGIPAIGVPIAIGCAVNLEWTIQVARWAGSKGLCLVVEVGFNPRVSGNGITWAPRQAVCGSTSSTVVRMLTSLVASVKNRLVSTAKATVEVARKGNQCISILCSLLPL